MLQSLEAMYDETAQSQKEAQRGVISLFSLIEQSDTHFLTPPPVLSPTPQMQLLQREKELLGFYLTGHPMDNYRKAARPALLRSFQGIRKSARRFLRPRRICRRIGENQGVR